VVCPTGEKVYVNSHVSRVGFKECTVFLSGFFPYHIEELKNLHTTSATRQPIPSRVLKAWAKGDHIMYTPMPALPLLSSSKRKRDEDSEAGRGGDSDTSMVNLPLPEEIMKDIHIDKKRRTT
jgi:hypothetical protein